MASLSTVVTSRRRQHELLTSWTGWPLTSIPIDPTEVGQVRQAGWSGTHHRDAETGERIVGTVDGLGFGVDDSWHNPVEVIPWSELEAIARAVPDEVRVQLVEAEAQACLTLTACIAGRLGQAVSEIRVSRAPMPRSAHSGE